MKTILINLFFISFLISYSKLVSYFESPLQPLDTVRAGLVSDPEPELRQAAFKLLKAKCNVCHKKKNPFKIFSLKNMDKHAPKIYKQVFVYQRMPKGSTIKLTDEEYQTLKIWLKSKNIF